MADGISDFFISSRKQEGDSAADGRKIFSVSEITRSIKEFLSVGFPDVWVEGEVSGVSRISTGTVFFSLKDGGSVLKCVIFPMTARALKFELNDGDKLVCYGGISVYEKDGRYQLYVRGVEPKGLGSLQLALEQLKKKLEKEGLFSPERKRPIPYLPARIGIVTSLSGAAVRDMLKVLDSRFKDARIIINPAKVQGEGAGKDIAAAIENMNLYNASLPPQERIEVMIVGRGGGSIEDLWAFNEEVVARAVFDSLIPVISAVGHERDWTVCDLVADARAATPSVAAEMVIPRKEDLKEKLSLALEALHAGLYEFICARQEDIDNLAHRIGLCVTHAFDLNRQRLVSAEKKLQLLNPLLLITRIAERFAEFQQRADLAVGNLLRIRQAEFKNAVNNLSNLSPLNVLSRGYSITFAAGGQVLRDAASAKEGQIITTRLDSGSIASRVTEVHENGGNKV